MEAQALAVEKPFASAEEKFEDLVARLSAEETQRLTHSELETLIGAEGRRSCAGSCRVTSICAPPASGASGRFKARTRSSARTGAAAREGS